MSDELVQFDKKMNASDVFGWHEDIFDDLSTEIVKHVETKPIPKE